ncbi:lamin tail domain-containing protein [Streptomyces sp. NBC_01003]|uniref:lamin tail domain-containing protein n=1 Tax=Streptomyces sp. NBC_01003 TaxID=2903714 RepID=UPI00386A66E7|nr:lamin tail domain-containing protein [Streptomyces sp. NBC_01003]
MSVSASVRRLTAVAAVAAATVGALALPATAAGHPASRPHGTIYISGVQYDSPGRDDRSNRSLNNEWVNITNPTRSAVNLNRWTLSDRDGHTYTFHHFTLRAHATVRVHTGIGRDTRTDLFQDRRAYVWDNNGDTTTLRNDHRRIIDAGSWGHHRR